MIDDMEFYALKRRVDELERRLEAMGGAAAVPLPPPQPATDPEIQQALAGGDKIEAIKLYRQKTGAGLAEAKLAIEDLEAQGFRLT